MRHTNHVSDNYYAETLLKGLGARSGTTGSTAAGAAIASSFARELDFRARVADGSGLSRANSISPHAVGRLLGEGTGRTVVRLLLPLPAAGRQVRHARQADARHAPPRGRCRAKTGTLSGVSALAGYCKTRSGKRAAFALLMNGVNVWTARRIQDRIAAELARYTG